MNKWLKQLLCSHTWEIIEVGRNNSTYKEKQCSQCGKIWPFKISRFENQPPLANIKKDNSKSIENSLILKMPEVHSDVRRTINELNMPENNMAIQSFIIHSDQILGNHYHKEKFEIFIVTKGSGKCVLKDINSDNEPEGTHIQKDSVIIVKQYTAHTFLFEPGSEMVCFCSSAYNEKDLYPFKLL